MNQLKNTSQTLEEKAANQAPENPKLEPQPKHGELASCGGRIIKLTQGQIAIVDEEDFKALANFKWYATRDKVRFYVRAVKWNKTKKINESFLIHRMIMKAKKGMDVDHINGNTMDNRRSNLRVCTHQENLRSHKLKGINATSKFRGVFWDAAAGKWAASARHENKKKHLGRYELETDAAKAYDRYVINNYGEFACPNFK